MGRKNREGSKRSAALSRALWERAPDDTCVRWVRTAAAALGGNAARLHASTRASLQIPVRKEKRDATEM